MNSILKFFSSAVLCWFITISVSLITGILFLADEYRGEVPMVISHLWVITISVLPVYAVVSFYPRKMVGILGSTVILLAMSYTLSGIHFRTPTEVTFIGAGEEMDEIESQYESEQEIDLELPDEL